MTLILREDFLGDSLDPSRWSTGWFGTGITHPVNGHETAAYDPACAEVHNGKLHLILKREPVVVGNTRFQYRTGCITSRDKFNTPGDLYYLESKIRPLGGPGYLNNWPAFWGDGLGTWPNDGENDVFEGLEGQASWHYHSLTGGPGGSVRMDGDSWHVFRAEVKYPYVDYFYDGIHVGQVANAVRKAHEIIFGHQAGSYGGNLRFGDMKVDYFEMGTL